MRRLLRGRTLQSLCEQTNAALLARIQQCDTVDIDAVNDAIDRLAASRLTTRRKAQQELLALGAPILPIIFSRPAVDLDAEQITRLREIASTLRPLGDDTPKTLSALLLYDNEHWLKIASRLSGDEVRLVNTHLSKMGRDPIAFAGAVTRVAQSEKNIR